MNLQRREEIRAIAECPNDRHWAQEMRRAVAELLAHIDTLEEGMVSLRQFAERCTQRDHQPDEHIGCAKCVACEAEDVLHAIPTDRVPGDELWVDASIIIATIETLDLFCREYINVEDVRRMAKERADHLRGKIDAIPADRGLGDGMVGVDRGDCALAVEWCHAVQDLNPGYLEAKDRAACERFNALRANQGGA